MKSISNTATALIAAVVIALDQLQKWVMLSVVYPAHQPPIHVTEFFSLVMVWNKGISFGLFNHPGAPEATPYLLTIMSLGIVGLLIRMAMKAPHRLEKLGYALVIGGALGNVIDRVARGAVADFFYFHIGNLGWPAFNIADSAICIGVFILLIAIMKGSKVKP